MTQDFLARTAQWHVGIQMAAGSDQDRPVPVAVLRALSTALAPSGEVVRMTSIEVNALPEQGSAGGRVIAISTNGTHFEITFEWPDENGVGEVVGPVVVTALRGRVRSAAVTQASWPESGSIEAGALTLTLDDQRVVALPLAELDDGMEFVERVLKAVGLQ